MAQLGNLLVTGSSRLLGKLFCENISVGNSLSVKTLSATNFTATSITTSGLTVNGNATTTGTLNVGNSQANGSIGSFKLDSTYLQSSDKTVGLSASSSDWAFWAGGFTSDTAKFRVTHAGQLYTSHITATGGTIGGWVITSDDIQGSNTYDGTLYTIGL